MKKNKLVAVCGHKYEPSWLVDQMHENLSGWVDEVIVHDNRSDDKLWMHEGEYRLKLREMAKKAGADWILITSPDERWEKDAGKIIRPLIDYNKDKVIYNFNLREMFSPTHYRIDGVWKKYRRRLYPLLPNQIIKYQPIQCPSMPQNADYEVKDVDVNIYHLKMIEPANRRLRTEVFKLLDPTNRFQGIGYDYLCDEYGCMLEEIPEGREYFPEYKKYIFEIPRERL